MRVLLGVGGGIAAFKAAELVRLATGRGHEVRCALTRSAERFVAPLTLEVLSGRAVHRQEYLEANGSGDELHITAAAWADVLCVAPATAHLIGRLALGLADDFLTTTALAFDGPLVVAPAMHSAMWEQPAVRANVEALRDRGAVLVGPVVGPLASGEEGAGRMAEPAEIVEAVEAAGEAGDLAGRRVLVTAGPTREYLDPVRFLSNRSSGRMSFALAAEAARRGAETVLVAGPVDLATPRGVRRVDVVSAREMADAVRRLAPQSELVVMAAAVADYRAAETAPSKHKRSRGPLDFELVENPDILAGLADVAPDALRVGFAAETGEPEGEARRKLAAKRVDAIVANDVSRPDIGFDVDANEVTVYWAEGDPVHLERAPKDRIARRLLDLLVARLPAAPDAADR
ncbi:MAG: bifunctional phosphopantothenoylcysteine decarboxylase/phosphopantothenate--cysteine ligase CoaBC [Thermoanaerobaculia bacterium]